jgi:hypothetical protein
MGPFKIKELEGAAMRVELAEGRADSYLKLTIGGQTKELFESLEAQSGVDFCSNRFISPHRAF